VTFRELLAKEFLTLTTEQLSLANQHYDLLVKWNSRMNLTRIESLEEAVQLHYCESFFLAQHLPPGPLKVADIGSGPGFPGIPAAILRPELHFTLIESNARKCVFLTESTRRLPNVHVLNTRAMPCSADWQSAADCQSATPYDWVISRAVDPQEVLTAHLARNHALLLSTKQEAPPTWRQIPIPWGINRILAISRETVSRETP